MSKIVIKLKDPSGSFYIASQGVSVNRNNVVEVEKDSVVALALLHGGVVEVSKGEFKDFTEKKAAAIEAAKGAAPAAKEETPAAFEKADAEKLVEQALDKGVLTLKEGVISQGKKELGTQEELTTELVEDEKLRAALTKAVNK